MKTFDHGQNCETGLHRGFTSDLGSRNSFPREEQVTGDVRRKAAGEGNLSFSIQLSVDEAVRLSFLLGSFSFFQNFCC